MLVSIENPYAFTVGNEAIALTAEFIQQHPLEVLVEGAGAVTSSPEGALFDVGTTVALTAVPAEGHRFVGWSGSADGSDNPLEVTINAAETITAAFEEIIPEVALEVNVSGEGAVTASPEGPYLRGNVVTLTAVPEEGHRFVGWSGTAVGADNPLEVTMDAAQAITATFEEIIPEVALEVNVSGRGTVTASPDGPYLRGSVATLTAVPAEGHRFVGWSGTAEGTDNPLEVTMNVAQTITATFEEIIPEVALEVNVNGEGTVTASPDGPYLRGAVVTLTAVPAEGHRFVGWSGPADGSDNPLEITLNAEQAVTATFEREMSAFEIWQRMHFSEIEIEQGLAAPDSDADVDRVANLLEYMAGTSPRLRRETPTLRVVSTDADRLSFDFRGRTLKTIVSQ